MDTTTQTKIVYRKADPNVILDQIGIPALRSVGFRDMENLGDGLQGRIGSPHRHLNLVIRLQGNDRYHVQVIRVTPDFEFATEFDLTDVYRDELTRTVYDGLNVGEGRR